MGTLRWLGLLMLLGAAGAVVALLKEALFGRGDVDEGWPARRAEPPEERPPDEYVSSADTIPAVLGLPEVWRDEQDAPLYQAPADKKARHPDSRAA